MSQSKFAFTKEPGRRRYQTPAAKLIGAQSCEPDSMLRGPSDGRPPCRATYGRPMKTHDVAPRTATTHLGIRREGRPVIHRSIFGALASVAVAIAIAACSPSASSVPGSVALPSVNVSAAASAASGAAIDALVQVDAAIDANQTAAGLTTDDVASLKALTAGIRTSLQTGDTTSAKTAVTDLSTKVDGFAAKLNTPAGEQLKAAIAALKAALG
jgi:hypothetical protein